jgi:hypothetical protein
MNFPEKIKRIANKAGGVGGIGDRQTLMRSRAAKVTATEPMAT